MKNNIALITVWGFVIFTGVLALGAVLGNLEGLGSMAVVHGIAARLGLMYTLVHIFLKSKFYNALCLPTLKGASL